MPFSSNVSEFKTTKTLTFSNDTGTLTLFTVTGDVKVSIIPICKTTLVSAAAGNIELGVSADVDAMIVSTLATNLEANEIWNDASPTSPIETTDTARNFIISNGDDVILTLSAQIDSGVIAFYCEWEPLSDGATVVAA